MNTNIIKQKHFKPINFNLQHVDLCFYLNPIKTHVINTMLFTNVIGDILLNGIGIELISISLNGKTLKPINKKKSPGLAKLPKKVRNKMGFMKKGGKVK